MVIDDLADRVHLADCLLDQSYFGPTQYRYCDLVTRNAVNFWALILLFFLQNILACTL